MLIAIAGTMPNRSVILPAITPPSPKPNIMRVKASDTAPRVAANSAWTAGIMTTIAHMPTPPIDPIRSAMTSRTQA
ncbi:hypothetical protein AB7M38_007915 [Bradyrhizobium diazoefficiens]